MSQFKFEFKEDGAGVNCLGLTFRSENERRNYFLNLLKQKLKEEVFRKTPGFPRASDEAILALSNPPYYTACPNPWLKDYVAEIESTRVKVEEYLKEPFCADVSEGKTHPIYNVHSYHTKVPHRAIMKYILHYTDPGDLVLDGFCGTGMTGVASQLCGNTDEVRELGFIVDKQGQVLDETGLKVSKIGSRRAILNDLSPAASFISSNFNTPISSEKFITHSSEVLDRLEDACSWLYVTLVDADEEVIRRCAEVIDRCKRIADVELLLRSKKALSEAARVEESAFEFGTSIHTIWSDVFNCSECGSEVVFWNVALDSEKGEVKEAFECSHCHALLNKRSLDRMKVSLFDKELGESVPQSKRVPVEVDYKVGKKRGRKPTDAFDLALMRKLNQHLHIEGVPVARLPAGGNTAQPAHSHGLTHVHHFYSRRNLFTAACFNRLAVEPIDKFILTAISSDISWLARVKVGYYFKGGGGAFIPGLSGTLYVPSISVEKNPIFAVENRAKTIAGGLAYGGGAPSYQSTGSATAVPIQDECIDYIFIDPPFGGNIMYSELNFIWEAWLGVITENECEAITSKAQSKSLTDYHDLMLSCFKEFYRVLKPGRWITIEFSNSQASVWNSIQAALQEAGFIVANVAALDKVQGSFKAVTSTTAVKQDLVISAYKPAGEMVRALMNVSIDKKEVWEFVSSHLKNLPVVKMRGKALEFVAERDPRILFDRMVAFYVGRSAAVPLSSAEFQEGLSQRFSERDGMFFLQTQVADYDKKRAIAESVGQLSIFVEDERSAINWLRCYLKNKPSRVQDIQPEFMQQLTASWKKWESKPELILLLSQNFICYDGEGEVPAPVHSYLSTQYHELRSLKKDDPLLRENAAGRWYVPDAKRNIDVESLRNKRLLGEFFSYLPKGYVSPLFSGNQQGLDLSKEVVALQPGRGKKLTEFRSEAIRAGFKACYQRKDYRTIIVVAELLPESLLMEDEYLQMVYDNAVTRTEVNES